MQLTYKDLAVLYTLVDSEIRRLDEWAVQGLYCKTKKEEEEEKARRLSILYGDEHYQGILRLREAFAKSKADIYLEGE